MLVEKLVTILEPRFYHACQLRDLDFYAELGHVASRLEMCTQNDTTRYTPFESDAFDKKNGHDASVFGNLSDGGSAYNNGRGMPNAYGPITLEFTIQALRNSGAREIFIRERGVFTKDILGARKIEHANGIRELYVKSNGYGRGEFELIGGTLHLADIARVTVAPIEVDEVRLIDEVRNTLAGVVICEIVARGGPQYQTEHYKSLLSWARDSGSHGGSADSLPDELKRWFDGLKGEPKTRASNLRRFARYMDHGTLSAMSAQSGHLEADFVGSAEYESAFDLFDISDIATITEEEREERDEFIARLKTAHSLFASSAHRYNRLLEQNSPKEDLDFARADANADFDVVAGAIVDANDWIDSMRRRIEGGIDEVSHRSPTAHDSYAVVELQSWRDSLWDLEYPTELNFSTFVEVPELDLAPLEDMQDEIESGRLADEPYD